MEFCISWSKHQRLSQVLARCINDNEDIWIAFDTNNNPRFDSREFKKTLSLGGFEITNIRLKTYNYYLGLEVKQLEEGTYLHSIPD